MKNSNKIAFALLAVASIGGLTALLLCTDKGARTREKIAKKSRKLWKKTKETADELVDKSSDIKDSVVKKAGEAFQ